MTHSELFILAFLGHLTGDYLFQNQWMAQNKSKAGLKAHWACTVHVLLYTAAVCLIMGTLNPWVWLAVAVPHWVIDRWSLAAYFLRWKNGKWPFNALMPNEVKFAPQQVWDVAFTVPVYIANDNTVHLLMLWLTIKAFF